jgi:putative transcriptional regulator
VRLQGRLLVAEPKLVESAFHRTVVYLINHDEDGALGVVLTRPGSLPVEEVVPGWGAHVSQPDVLFIGGPVTPEAAICLGRCPGGSASSLWRGLEGEIGVVDLNGDPLLAPDELCDLRVFAGYAGWSPQQLESELEMDGWFVVDTEPSDLFTPEPETLWHDVLARQTGPLRRYAPFPEDPSVN